MSHQPNLDKLYLYAKDLYKAKHQLLINKRESTGLKHLYGSKAFIECSNKMDNIYKNMEEYKPNKKTQNIDCFWDDWQYA